jgi:hypothetical protein
MLSQDLLICYPDPKLTFDNETDSSEKQLSAIMKQANHTFLSTAAN